MGASGQNWVSKIYRKSNGIMKHFSWLKMAESNNISHLSLLAWGYMCMSLAKSWVCNCEFPSPHLRGRWIALTSCSYLELTGYSTDALQASLLLTWDASRGLAYFPLLYPDMPAQLSSGLTAVSAGDRQQMSLSQRLWVPGRRSWNV